MLVRLPLDFPAIRRIAWAFGLSIAVHAAAVALIQMQPGGISVAGSSWSVLEASIEQPTPDAGEPARLLPDASREMLMPVSPRTMAAAQPGFDAGRARAAAAIEAQAAPAAAGGASKTQASGDDMLFARDPNYYAVAALDSPPRLLGSADVCYPQGAAGEVAYDLMLNEQGVVDRVAVASAHPLGLSTGVAAELCGQLKFTPGIKDGRAVRSRIRLVVGANPV
jgi:hypothetical protein